MEKYRTEGQKFWHGKFWLETPATFTKFDLTANGKTYRPNVYCRFRLEASDTAFKDGAHKTITVVKLKKKEFFQSNDSLYDNYDIDTRPTEGARKQLPLVHEIGHALGMLHVANLVDATKCGGADLNDDVCYGTTAAEKDNVMGKAMKLTTLDAKPWLERLSQHTGAHQADWRIHLNRVYPKVVA